MDILEKEIESAKKREKILKELRSVEKKRVKVLESLKQEPTVEGKLGLKGNKNLTKFLFG